MRDPIARTVVAWIAVAGFISPTPAHARTLTFHVKTFHAPKAPRTFHAPPKGFHVKVTHARHARSHAPRKGSAGRTNSTVYAHGKRGSTTGGVSPMRIPRVRHARSTRS